MRIVANGGGNLPESMLRVHRIEVAPLRIVVDDVEHDVPAAWDYDEVERWIASARTYPHPVSGSAPELVELMRRLATKDPEWLAITGSRRLVASYVAAVSAARALASSSRIEVIDAGSTDVGIGLTTLVAAKAAHAGLSLADAAKATRAFAASGHTAIVPERLDYLVRSGYAPRAPDTGHRPLLAFVDGDVRPIDVLEWSPERARDAIVAYLVSKVDAARPVWIGINHASVPSRALELEAALRKRFDVRFALVRAMHPAVYLSAGPGGLLAFVAPIDTLPFAID